MDDSPQKAAPPRRAARFRWLRFSLRTMFILVTIFAAWLGLKVHQARRQQAAVAGIRALGGWVHYDYQFVDAKPNPQNAWTLGKFDMQQTSWVPEWLLEIPGLGEDFFHDVLEVNMCYNEDGPERLDNLLTTDQLKEHLPAFPRLRQLLLNQGQATDDCLRVVGQLGSLEAIYMWDASDVTDAGVAHLRNLQGLRFVHLSKSQITDESLRVLGTLRRIEGLGLQENHFTDAGLAHLKALTELRVLAVSIGDTRITDAGLEHLHGLKKLQVLAIPMEEVTLEGVTKLENAIPGLLVGDKQLIGRKRPKG